MDFTELLALAAQAVADMATASNALMAVGTDVINLQTKIQAMSAANPGDGGGSTDPLQAQLDAANALVAQLQSQLSDLTTKDAADVQAAVDAKAAGDAAVATVQGQLDALSAKEAPEAATIANLQQAFASLQSVVAVLAGLQIPIAPVDPQQPSV